MGQVRLGRAKNALDRGDISEARKNLNWVLKNAKKDKAAIQEAVEATARLDAIGQNMLAEGNAARKAGDLAGAVAAYRTVRATLAGRPAGKRARAWLEKAAKDPKLVPAMREADARKAFEGLEDATAALQPLNARPKDVMIIDTARRRESIVEAIGRVPRTRRAGLIKRLQQIARTHAKTPTGRRAAKALQQLQPGRRTVKPRNGADKAGSRRRRKAVAKSQSRRRCIRIE